MRFMIIVKATKDSEAGVMPEEKLFAEMATYHEELAKAGMLLDGSGLQPSSKGWRIKYAFIGVDKAQLPDFHDHRFAMHLLESFGLDRDASRPVGELAYGRQRLLGGCWFPDAKHGPGCGQPAVYDAEHTGDR